MSDNNEKLINDIQNLRNLITDMQENEFTEDFESIFNSNFDTLKEELSQLDYEKTQLKYTSEDKELFYNYESDSGFDLYSTEDVVIEPFGRSLVPTGVKFDIPIGHEIQVRSKSGLALKQGLMVLNSPGTVDEGYTGEVKVIMFNTTQHSVMIEKGTKVAQAVLSRCLPGKWVDLVKVDVINNKDRNEKGFGSTGI
jgi:dUTP pyrophosphatase